MNDAAASWAPQQLAEFLGAVSRASGRGQRGARGRRARGRGVEAECAALVRGDTVLASVGWPRFDVPERQLAAVAAARERCHRRAGRRPVPRGRLGAGGLGHANSSSPAPARRSTPDETTLLRGMVRGLALTMRLLRDDRRRALAARPRRPRRRRERPPARDAAQAPARAGGDGPDPARDLPARAAGGRAGDDRRRRRRAARRRRPRARARRSRRSGLAGLRRRSAATTPSLAERRQPPPRRRRRDGPRGRRGRG